MADPLCRWRNSTPKTVCELVSQLPKTQLPSSEFRSLMKQSVYGDGFFTTPYQLACQLGLYTEVDGKYIPRFCRNITEEEANQYLIYWFRNYYVPNPYTKRGFLNMETPIIVLDAFIEYLKTHGYSANFKDIANSVFGEPINNVDILVNCFRNYSKVIDIDKSLNTILSPNFEQILNSMTMDRIDKSAFFHQFEINTPTKNHRPLTDQPLQLIYYGAPGTGKSFTIDKVTDEKNSVRTTFHPDSDYAGFVGAYKPTMECVPMSAFVGKEVHVAQPQGEHTGTERKIVYKYVPQAFLKAYIEAWKRYSENEDNPYYLVIEEINRGNCAQIFGDLFQLLDRNSVGSSSYAINADEDIAQFLRDDKNGFAESENFTKDQRDVIKNFVLKKDSGSEEHIGPSILNGSKLLLPPNMRIWATMNTSDQSLFPIDSAFKRRWNWEYMPIEYDKKDWTFVIGGKRYSWGKFLEYINPKILELTQSEDKQMGYFFAKPDKKSNEDLQENDTISAKVFVNKVLFYLWTDVFKDYDLTQKPFVYEDKDNNNVQKAYRFTDFFPIDNSKKLLDFVEGMGLPIVDTSTDEAENVDNEEENNNSGRTLDRYTLNGNGNFLMGPVAMQAMNMYISNNPDQTANDIVAEWSIFNRPKVYTAEQYEEKKSKSTDARIDQKHAKFDLANGEAIYMSIGFIPDSMAEFIRILDTKDWGITIRKIDR